MNTDNLSALAVGVGVVALIAGFGVYFNNPDLNKAASGQQKNFVPAAIIENGTVTEVQIDKSQFKLAPELAQISGYINTDLVTLADLRGKVVLIDFWTYSCINCIRTIPYLNAWYEKYADDGLVIVGVHTPEFEFEKDYDNVKAAVEKFGIKYPVAQDNDKGTWKAYENRYWPRKYLVDNEGYIRYDHIGEGSYAETEKVIQSLLLERAAYMGITNTTTPLDQSISNPKNAQSVNFGRIDTPELYFGYQFARAPLGNPEGFRPDQTVKYTIPEDTTTILPNRIYLDGGWKNNADHMELQSETGRVVLSYSAKAVNIVAGGSSGSVLYISEDGSSLTGSSSRGADVSEDGTIAIDGQKLYNLAMHENYGKHQLVINVKGKGFEIYTFTFG
ncbi:thiol-disulfide isomerase [Candidatus Nitrososphaera gargensis Ga9.2]|uniref:Thiol-disulfide isomerase n=1 Tax=Nitrososphaera gargensis (strain Ga9.2) TaxID=1237085 RepID=K0INX2_NITGG|nr:thioredoxin family protein [Candidatus Nitrososphaera gargensis]AFU60119.1 thiol-disulfide isomerase [Candidatus Nitrososphaera gargensis Ga9.2]